MRLSACSTDHCRKYGLRTTSRHGKIKIASAPRLRGQPGFRILRRGYRQHFDNIRVYRHQSRWLHCPTNGDIDWLVQYSQNSDEDYGYKAFMETVDCIVMERHTYERVLTFEAWPFSQPVVVLSSRAPGVPDHLSQSVEIVSDTPAALLARLAARGIQHVYVDGGQTIQSFLREGLVQRLILTRVPVLLGAGLPLFGALPHDIRLQHIETRQFAAGLVQSEYRL